jgi:predicted MFS family arabinose efflux permease
MRATYREVFAEPVFRTLFLTRALATGANSLRILALSVLVFKQTGSALLTAVTFGIGFVPQVIGGTLLGALADRIRPRGLIVGGFLVDATVAIALGTLPLPVGASLALVAVAAVLSPVFNGASNRLIAERLIGDAYVLGRSLSTVSSAGAQLLGLGLGGIALAALGPQRALLVACVCHLTSAAWVRLRLPAFPRPSEATGSAVRQSWSTTGTLLRDRTVRDLLVVQWLPPAFLTGAEALVVPYVADRGEDAGVAGLMLAATPVGMLLGSLVVGRLLTAAAQERLVAPLMIGLGAPVAVLALPVPLPVVAFTLMLVGAAFAYSLGVQKPFVAALDPNIRGQAFALLTTGLMTLQGLGPLVTGAIAQWLSTSAAMAAAGAGVALVGLWWWFGRARPASTVVAPSTATTG